MKLIFRLTSDHRSVVPRIEIRSRERGESSQISVLVEGTNRRWESSWRCSSSPSQRSVQHIREDPTLPIIGTRRGILSLSMPTRSARSRIRGKSSEYFNCESSFVFFDWIWFVRARIRVQWFDLDLSEWSVESWASSIVATANICLSFPVNFVDLGEIDRKRRNFQLKHVPYCPVSPISFFGDRSLINAIVVGCLLDIRAERLVSSILQPVEERSSVVCHE